MNWKKIKRVGAIVLLVLLLSGKGFLTWKAMQAPEVKARIHAEMKQPFSGIDFILGFGAAGFLLFMALLAQSWRLERLLEKKTAGSILYSGRITMGPDGTIKIGNKKYKGPIGNA